MAHAPTIDAAAHDHSSSMAGSAITVESYPAYGLLGVVILAATALMTHRGLSLVGPDFTVLGIAAALLVLVAWCLRGRGWWRVAMLIESWTLMTTFCVVLMLLSFASGASDVPLADAMLANADRLLLPWFDWPTAMRTLADWHPVMTLANGCYASIGWQPALLLVICAASGRSTRCWTFVVGWMTALLIVAAVFALMPGLGAYAHFGIAASEVPAMRDPTPWTQPATLTALRDGTMRAIAFTDLEGIVTFPSFHAAAAVLLAWGFRPLRWIGVPMLVWNAGMMAAAVPIGGHYLADIPAGIAVAAAAILIARRLVQPNTRAKIVSTCL